MSLEQVAILSSEDLRRIESLAGFAERVARRIAKGYGAKHPVEIDDWISRAYESLIVAVVGYPGAINIKAHVWRRIKSDLRDQFRKKSTKGCEFDEESAALPLGRAINRRGVEYEPYLLAQNHKILKMVGDAHAATTVSVCATDPDHSDYLAHAKTLRRRVASQIPFLALEELVSMALAQMDQVMLRAVDALPEPYRTLFTLHWDLVPNLEAAKLLGITQPTAHRLLEEACLTVRSILSLIEYEQDLKRLLVVVLVFWTQKGAFLR